MHTKSTNYRIWGLSSVIRLGGSRMRRPKSARTVVRDLNSLGGDIIAGYVDLYSVKNAQRRKDSRVIRKELEFAMTAIPDIVQKSLKLIYPFLGVRRLCRSL